MIINIHAILSTDGRCRYYSGRIIAGVVCLREMLVKSMYSRMQLESTVFNAKVLLYLLDHGQIAKCARMGKNNLSLITVLCTRVLGSSVQQA